VITRGATAKLIVGMLRFLELKAAEIQENPVKVEISEFVSFAKCITGHGLLS
jgi:hypothetical protein